MSSVELARECLDVVDPLLEMIVDGDEQHNGQLMYADSDKTVGDALTSLSKLLKSVNKACADLKKRLAACAEKKIDRKCDEGILIHMILKATLLVRDEIQRLKSLDSKQKLEDRYFPTDKTGKEVKTIQQLIKQRNGDADAESISSVSTIGETASVSSVSSAASSSVGAASSSETLPKEPAKKADESSSTAVEKSAESAASEASVASVSSTASTASEKSEPKSETESTATTTISKPAVKSDDSISAIIEEASAVLDVPQVEPLPSVVDYSSLSADDLEKEAKKQKTLAQKDAFIAQLILLLRNNEEPAEKEEVAKKEEKEEQKEETNEGETFIVEDVSKFKRTRDGVAEVLVKWKGFPIEAMTWEPSTEELSKRNIGGSFFDANDTSYKKFCSRVGLTEECSKMEKKQKEKCESKKGKEACDKEEDDTTTTDDEDNEEKDDTTTEDEEKEDDTTTEDEEDEKKEKKQSGVKSKTSNVEKEKEELFSDEESSSGGEFAKIPTPEESEAESNSVEEEASRAESVDDALEEATVESVDE